MIDTKLEGMTNNPQITGKPIDPSAYPLESRVTQAGEQPAIPVTQAGEQPAVPVTQAGEQPAIPMRQDEVQPVNPVEQTEPVHNRTETPSSSEATKSSDSFLHKVRHGFLRSIGHIFRTASTEFFTWIGSTLIPVGISVAATFSFAKDKLRTAFDTALQNAGNIPAFKLQDDLYRKIGGLLNNSTMVQEGYHSLLKQGMEKFIDLGPFLGVGISAIGALSALVGAAIGWKGARHRQGTSKLFTLGKFAEMVSATAGIINPAAGFLYPVAKGFSIGATLISQTGRP